MRKERRGREVEKMRGKGIIVGGMVLSLLLGCNNGIAELEKENSFYKSVVKIGQGFQEIFGIFGSALGFSAVKSGDSGSTISEYFDKVKKGLGNAKDQLDGLEKEIASTPHSDTKGVEDVIKSASGVFEKLIGELDKLAKITKEAGEIGAVATNKAIGANKISVNTFISGIREIIETVTNSGVKLDEGKGKEGTSVTGGDAKAPAALVGKASAAAPDAKAGPALADEVAKADPWAMINKIKDATTKDGDLKGDTSNNAGELATGNGIASVGAKSTADLAAAVALKAITKDGKFAHNSSNAEEAGVIKGAAASAVNKVLGVLDEIIRRTVNHQLGKIKDAVKGIQYSENASEKSEAATK